MDYRLGSQSTPDGRGRPEPCLPTQLVPAASKAINGLAILVAMLILAEGSSRNWMGAKGRWVGLGPGEYWGWERVTLILEQLGHHQL